MQHVCIVRTISPSRTNHIAVMPRPVLVVALIGAIAALGGGMWDDAWHTERGRDNFFIAPHIGIYAGVSLVGLAVGLWLVRALRDGVDLRAEPALLLAVIAVLATLASGPIDNGWHEAFGRDALIWSPPHMLGIAGTLTLGVVLLTQVRGRAVLSAVTGAMVLAAATFPVIEWDTDVPQFASVWYLPALTVGLAVGLGLVRLTAARNGSATVAAATHLAFVLCVSAFLLLEGFDAPGLPLLLVPALLLDLADRRAWRPSLRAAALTVGVFAAYVPVRNWIGHGVDISATDVLLGAPIAWIATLAVEAIAWGTPRLSRRGVGAAAVAALLLAAPAALAHDPGQGSPSGTAALALTADHGRLDLRGRLDPCVAINNGSLVARRAGNVVRAPMTVNRCAFRGAFRVAGRGRWFVYADLSTTSGTIETWLPIHADRRESVSDQRRFAYDPDRRPAGTFKYLGGGLLYAAMLALLVATFALVRRDARARREGGPAAIAR